jgi:hypothetical protein
MTATRACERQIVQQLLRRRGRSLQQAAVVPLINGLAIAAAIALLLTFLPVAPWIGLPVALAVCLGIP